MVIRACVAALDWNYNINRQQRKSKTGELQYRKKVSQDFPIITKLSTKYLFIQVDRSGQNSTVTPLKVEKDTSWQDMILFMCLEGLSSNQMPEPKVILKQFLSVITNTVLVSCRGRKGPKKEEPLFKGNNKQTKQARAALCQAQNLVLLA